MRDNIERIVDMAVIFIFGAVIGAAMHASSVQSEYVAMEATIAGLEYQRAVLINSLAMSHRDAANCNDMINRFIEADGGHVLQLPEMENK